MERLQGCTLARAPRHWTVGACRDIRADYRHHPRGHHGGAEPFASGAAATGGAVSSWEESVSIRSEVGR
jgi:hypothetical protein